MFVIKKINSNLYVAKPGRGKSYTNTLKYAQKYDNRKHAEGCCCENERAISMESIINKLKQIIIL